MGQLLRRTEVYVGPDKHIDLRLDRTELFMMDDFNKSKDSKLTRIPLSIIETMDGMMSMSRLKGSNSTRRLNWW